MGHLEKKSENQGLFNLLLFYYKSNACLLQKNQKTHPSKLKNANNSIHESTIKKFFLKSFSLNYFFFKFFILIIIFTFFFSFIFISWMLISSQH